MLKQRLITAGILVSIVLAAIIWFPPLWFQGFIALLIALGAWEWTVLAGVVTRHWRAMYTALCLVLLYLSLHMPPELGVWLLMGSVPWWLAALVLVCMYPQGTWWHRSGVLLPIGLLVLLPGWQALVFLRGMNGYVFAILVPVALVVAADSGAYFAGRAFGKRKLAVHVSPNKTWEGFAGGQLAACTVSWLVLGALAFNGTEITATQVLAATLGTLVVSAASVVGDLFESMLKRQAGVKDSGTLLPGHGGVLDRMDSLTAALPLYALFLGMYLGLYA